LDTRVTFFSTAVFNLNIAHTKNHVEKYKDVKCRITREPN